MPPSSQVPRVLLLSHYFPAHRGGVEIVAGELATRLGKEFSIRWMAADTDPPPADMPHVQCEAQPAWNGLEAKGLPWPLWSWRGWKRLYRALAECHILHLHDFIYPSHLVALLLARRMGKPVVLTQHIGDIDYRNPLLRLLLRGINRSVGRCMLGLASQVVFISPRVKAGFAAYTRFSRPPLYWPNGVDTSVFRPVSASERLQLRQAHGLRPDAPVILFVGRFVERKGLPLLAAMVPARPDWQWCFAGWGSLDPAGWGQANAFVWQGRQGASLASLYQLADLLVLPSHGEGFPLVVQEALACGTPVLVAEETAAGGPAIPGCITALPHDPRHPDPAAWIAAIAGRLDSHDLLACRQRCTEAAQQRWDWDRLAVAYGACFRQLLPGEWNEP